MGVLGKANIGGVLRNLTGEGYVNIGGVLRPITIGKYNIGGVLLAGGYTWKKYNTVATTTYEQQQEQLGYIELNVPGNKKYACAHKSYTFDASNGKYTLADYEIIEPYYAPKEGYKYFGEKFSSKNEVTGVMYESSDYTVLYDLNTYKIYVCMDMTIKHTSAAKTTYLQGTYIGDVTSPNETEYPENGRHTDGYWYVKQ